MNELKDYVDFRLTHSDKHSEAQGYPLELSDCKKHKPMRDLKIYGNSFQAGTPSPETPIEVQSVGELVANETDVNYGKYKIPVVQRGINLFSMAKCNATTQTINGITFTPLDDERVHVKGKVTDTSKSVDCQILLKEYVYLKAGKYKSKRPSNEMAILFYIYGVGNINSSHNYTTISSGGVLKHAYLYIPPNTVREFDDIIELQLVKGEEDLPYEPYVEPVTTNIFLDEPLRKLGDYADFVDFKENKVVRRNREITLKPEDITWRYAAYSTQYGYYLYGTQHKPAQDAYNENFYTWNTNQPEKASHLKACIAYSQSIAPNGWYVSNNYDIHLALPQAFYASDGVSSTLADIQAWMQSQIDAGTPLKFTYRLKEPIEEPISLDLPKLNAKTTIIEVDTSLAPSNAYGKYIKK